MTHRTNPPRVESARPTFGLVRVALDVGEHRPRPSVRAALEGSVRWASQSPGALASRDATLIYVTPGWRGLLPVAVREASDSVYHYTDSAGLMGVLTRHELWATEAAAMNDIAEVRQGWDFIREWVTRQRGRRHPAMGMIEFLAAQAEDADPPFGHSGTSPDGIYMCCASVHGDDANQWRLYGGGGHGYAVELDPSTQLMAVLPGCHPRGATAGDEDGGPAGEEPHQFVDVTPWLHVLYSEEQKSAAFTGLVKTAERQLKRIEKESVRARRDQGDYYGIREAHDAQIAIDLARLAQLMKSDGFSGEHEVRVIVVDQFASRPDLVAQFRATPFGVVRYARLSAPSDIIESPALCADVGGRKLPITGVRLGPLIRPNNNKSTVHSLLHSSGYLDSSVSESLVPANTPPDLMRTRSASTRGP